MLSDLATSVDTMKGLKSSLICRPFIFSIGIPKNGFGVEDLVGSGFGVGAVFVFL